MRYRVVSTASLLLLAVAALVVAQPAGLERGLRIQQRSADRHPDRPSVWNDLGNLLVLDEQYEEAEEAYRVAVALDPDYASARFNLALLLQETRRPDAALGQLKRLLQAHPDHAWGHYQAGILLDQKRRDSRALRHYTRALILDPTLAEPEVNPHIVRNRLRTRALLKAYRTLPPATVAPRVYDNPKRVAKLLVPVLPSPRRQKPPPAPADQEEPRGDESAADDGG